MRAMAQWWAAPTRRTMFARDMHARVRRQARPCQRLPWESRARVSSRPVRRQELDGCRARSTTAVNPRSRVDASRRTFCHHLHESVQCTHWPDAGPRRLNRAPSQADLALLRQVTPAGASLGETASAVFTAGWKKKERKKTDNPREGWEDGTPPPHRDFLRRGECGANRRPPLGVCLFLSLFAVCRRFSLQPSCFVVLMHGLLKRKKTDNPRAAGAIARDA